MLDIILPGLSGYRVLERLRAAGVDTPVLLLSAKDGEVDQADGLDLGADGYLVKPFSFVVLVAQLKAMLRRRDGVRAGRRIALGALIVDPVARSVTWSGRSVELSPREFALLHALVSHPDTAVTKDELLRLLGRRAGREPQRRRGLRRLPAAQTRRGGCGRCRADRARARLPGLLGVSALRAWWGRRPLRARITLTVGAVALVALLALSRLATALAFDALVDSTDQELRAQAEQAVAQAGSRSDQGSGRAGDRPGGAALDGGPPLPLDARQVGVLVSGEGTTTQWFSAPLRWVAVPALAPDGTPRLVVASADLVGGTALMRRTAGLAVVGALFATLVVAGAAWVATRAALRRSTACGPPPRRSRPATGCPCPRRVTRCGRWPRS